MRLPRLPRAAAFDMDGTIFNTEALYCEALVVAGSRLGLSIDQSLPLSTVGVSWDDTRLLLGQHFGDPFLVDSLIDAWLRHFDEIAATSISLKPGVVELLDRLDALGVPSAIVTSSYRDDVHRHLSAHALGPRFATIVTNEDCEVAKPAPQPFLLAAHRLGVDPSECIALEDSAHGVIAAATAGMMTIMIPDLIELADGLRDRCVFVARDLHQVVELLDQRFAYPTEMEAISFGKT